MPHKETITPNQERAPKVKKSTRKIFVRDLKLDAHIGVYDHEHGQTQPLTIDFELEVQEPDNPASDRLDDVVCYNKFTQAIKKTLASGHIQLVETLAEQICSIALEHPMVISICVRIEKLNAIPEARGAGVEIFKSKS